MVCKIVADGLQRKVEKGRKPPDGAPFAVGVANLYGGMSQHLNAVASNHVCQAQMQARSADEVGWDYLLPLFP